MMEETIGEALVEVLVEPDIHRKLMLAEEICRSGNFRVKEIQGPPIPSQPGRPKDWRVLPTEELQERPSLTQADGRRALLHSVAHIELSAVELPILAILEFPGREAEYYRDMLYIIAEEVRHTRWLIRRLEELGEEMGSRSVHLGLWHTARAYPDLCDRLAVVPRILEARGLDVSHKIRRQLVGAGDRESARILEEIYLDEIKHVALGTKWFRRVCRERGLSPISHFLSISRKFQPSRPVAIDREGRRRAGFSEAELEFVKGKHQT